MPAPKTVTIQPTYSHGGTSDAAWPAVQGDSVSSGNPVSLYQGSSNDWPALICRLSAGASLTYVVEMHEGPPDAQGNFDASGWIDIGLGALTANSRTVIPSSIPYVRTRITIRASGTLTSCIPCIPLPDGTKVSAQHPSKISSPN
jgi:hypothetical protein